MHKICFLFGHRDAPDRLLPQLEEAIIRQYTQLGIREFISGHYGRFDAMAHRALINVKPACPGMILTLLTPYHPAQHPQPLPPGFDGALYPDGMERVPNRLAIVRANRMMIGRCDAVICYAVHPGNCRTLLDAARRREQNGTLHIDTLL